jgi:hypothetical protein
MYGNHQLFVGLNFLSGNTCQAESLYLMIHVDSDKKVTIVKEFVK